MLVKVHVLLCFAACTDVVQLEGGHRHKGKATEGDLSVGCKKKK